MHHGGAGHDLDAALARVVEAALQADQPAIAGQAATAPDGAASDAGSATERTRRVAQALAAGLRELLRAPLREALQAGYELGYRAALEAQRAAEQRPVGTAPSGHSPALAAAEPTGTSLGASGPLGDPPPTPAHEVLVEVGPFPGFSAVNRFHAAVAAAPEVADATIVHFREGQLTLRVVHPDGCALAAGLVGQGLGPLRVAHAERDRLELVLTGPSGQAATSGGAAPEEGLPRPRQSGR